MVREACVCQAEAEDMGCRRASGRILRIGEKKSMGLFDKFKKQNKEEEAVETPKVTEEGKAEASVDTEKVAETPKVEETKAEEEKKPTSGDTAIEDQRFTLLVEEGFQLKDDFGVVVAGILYGTVQKGDAVYVIHPSGNVRESKVETIEIGPEQGAEKAQNQNVAIRLADITDKNQLPKYTVLTNIKPQTEVNVNTVVENPQLLALSREYPRLCKDVNYLNLLVYVACHAHYVVPVSVDNEPKANGDGTVTSQKETMVRFPSLQNPKDKSTSVFPIFTDKIALSKWKNVFDEKHPPKTMIVRFPDVVSISKGNAVVLNPFGPTPVMLDAATIQNIVNMEGYKKEFGGNAQGPAQKVPSEQDAKLMVGVPKENDEIKKIKDALKKHANQVEAIKRIDFLLKIDARKERAYLCVVDCPQEQAEKIFKGMNQAAAPYFNEIKSIEFMLYGKSKMANDIVSELSCIYQA